MPEGAICGRSAARLWGAIVPDSADVEILLNRKQRTLIKGLRMHRPAQPPPTTMRYGLRVTTPEATFLKLAGELELVDLVVAGDTLCKKATTPQKLVAAAASFRGKRARLAREAAALVRSRVDSPQETKVRLLMVLAGIPEPTVNIVFRDEGGQHQAPDRHGLSKSCDSGSSTTVGSTPITTNSGRTISTGAKSSMSWNGA